MQPVPCWEKVWGPPDGAPPGTTLRVLKWVKTDKVQVRVSKQLFPLNRRFLLTHIFPSSNATFLSSMP